jgi:hypothetical protein
MKNPSHPWREAVPPSVLERVDKICDRFEDAWLSATSVSDRPHIEDYLHDTPEPERAVLLRELITLDADYRRRSGEVATEEDFGLISR